MEPLARDIAAVLSRTPAIVRGLLEGASPAAIEFHERPEAWSPRQVLCHVADGEITDWIPRLELILSSPDAPRFTPFDREGGFARFEGWPIGELLNEFDRLRAASLARLGSVPITEADLRRTAVHPDLGIVTLAQLLACWATHDLSHIAQITRSLVRHHGPDVGPWRKYFTLLAE
jgi:hypothetical protein